MVRELKTPVGSAGPRRLLAAASEIPRGAPKVIMELFSGCARLSRCMAEAGIDAEAWDVSDSPLNDLLRPSVLRQILKRIEDGEVCLVWLGTPCHTFSIARKLDGKGPPPLRSDSEPMGSNTLLPHDRRRLAEGNEMFRVSMSIMEVENKMS